MTRLNTMHKWGIATFLLAFIPLIIIVPLLTSFQFQTAHNNFNAENSVESTDSQDPFNDAAQSTLAILASVSSLDNVNYVAKTSFYVYPLGALSRKNYTLASFANGQVGSVSAQTTPSANINVTFGGSLVQFRNGLPMSEQSLSLALDSGDSSLYPFDSYSLQFEIVATVNNNGTISQIPVLLTTQSVLPLFKIDSTIPSFPDTAEVTAAVHFERSRTAKFFSIFIIINMWVLGCSLFALATGIWIRGRKVEPPTIAACLAFIFALPNVRNAQPGIPIMTGCVSDLLSFYWVMILASVSGALVIINYCVSYKAAPKAPKPQLAEMNMDMKNVTSTELPISNA